jgi:two-component system nitrate/nitrite response regulator NarL
MTHINGNGNGSNGNGVPPQAAQPSPEVRVILADSQAIYRVGMRKVFSPDSGVSVVAEADNLQGLQDTVQRVPADVLLLEGAMINGNANAVPAVVRLAPDLKIIVQAASTDESHTVDLYRRGVRGIIPRSISPDRSLSLPGRQPQQPAQSAPPQPEGDAHHRGHHSGQAQ